MTQVCHPIPWICKLTRCTVEIYLKGWVIEDMNFVINDLFESICGKLIIITVSL